MASAITLFFDKLTAVSPKIASVAQDHLRDNGELLPHMLMADVARALQSDATCSGSPNCYYQQALAVIEDVYLVQNEIVNSVIELSLIDNWNTDFVDLLPLSLRACWYRRFGPIDSR